MSQGPTDVAIDEGVGFEAADVEEQVGFGAGDAPEILEPRLVGTGNGEVSGARECHVREVEETGEAPGQMQLLAYSDSERNSTYDPATTVSALPHFKFHLLSRSARTWKLLSGLARLVIGKRTMGNRCVKKDKRDMMVVSMEIGFRPVDYDQVVDLCFQGKRRCKRSER